MPSKDKAWFTHGHTRDRKMSPEYRAWLDMIQRCTNDNHIRWDRYGGRGIKVCTRWLNSFENFLKSVGQRPGPDYTLERKNNERNYTPRNVRWATKRDQQRNTSRNHNVTINGVTKCISAWVEDFEICPSVVGGRIKSGWPPMKALTTPIMKRGSWSRRTIDP